MQAGLYTDPSHESLSAQFCNKNVHINTYFWNKKKDALWDWCFVGFVQQVY